MKCKNCNHEIKMDELTPFHPTGNRGIGYPCFCGCKNPERKRKPIGCKNCDNKCELVKRNGRYKHLAIYAALNSRYSERLVNNDGSCFRHRCKNPEPIIS